jgi:cytochrome P450
MTATDANLETHSDTKLEDQLLLERELWPYGPPHALFKDMRERCPVHWTREVSEFPEEGGFWSVTRAEDVHTVSRDWQTYSSELGGITVLSTIFPIELTRAMFIGMDPPKHDRVKALFQAGFTPKRIAAHEDAIREIVRNTLDGLDGRERCDLVNDVAQPVVSRVIGSFMGIPEEDDATWARLMNSTLGAGDPDLNPDGVEAVMEKEIPEIFQRCGAMIARRNRRRDA